MMEPGQGARVDRRARRTRQVLEQALLELIEEQPYETITIQQITDRANVGRATFYLHYPDKEQLLLATFHVLTDDLVRHLPQPSAQEILKSENMLGTAVFEHVAQYRRLYRALLGEHGPALVVRRLSTYLAEQVQLRVIEPLRAVGKERSPAVPPTFPAVFLSGSLLAAVAWWLDRNCQETPDEMVCLLRNATHPGLLQMLGLEAGARMAEQNVYATTSPLFDHARRENGPR